MPSSSGLLINRNIWFYRGVEGNYNITCRMKNKQKYWRYFTYLYCGVILIAPISRVYTGPYGTNQWMTQYVLNTFEYSFLVLPVMLILLLISEFKDGKIKQLMTIVMYSLSGFISYIAFQSSTSIMQDLVPKCGMLLLVFLFPVVLLNSFVERRVDE